MKKLSLLILVLVLLGACKTTKYVPEDEYLLQDVKITASDEEFNTQELTPFLKQKPNLKILWLVKFHLGIYNLSGTNLDRWWNRWFRRIGEEPVIYDPFLTDRSALEIEKHLHNSGYLYARVSDTTIFNKEKQKAKVLFNIDTKEPFTILDHTVLYKDDEIKQLVQQDSANSLIKVGNNFDINVLNKERDRISNLLRQNGYYNFSKEYIYFKADSSVQPLKVVDTMVIANPTMLNSLNQRVETRHAKYTVRDVYFITDFDPQQALKNQGGYYSTFDTLLFDSYKILYKDKIRVKPVILTLNSLIKPGDLYNYKNVERTHSLLSSIPMIKYVNIRFVENKGNDHTLDCYIQLTNTKSQGYSVDIEGTHQSGILGAALNLGYNHKNLFKGAEMFNTKFSYALEHQRGLTDKDGLNSNELGFEASMLYPRFLFPFFSKRFNEDFKSKTNFVSSYNYQKRPDYVRHIASMGMQYQWRGNNNWAHRLDVIDWNYVSLPFKEDTFKNYIDTTFLRYSYEDHVILGLGYTITYNDQDVRRYRDSKYLRFSIESSGNTLYGYNSLFNRPKNENDAYDFVGIRFSQYLKLDIEGTYNRRLDEKNSVVYHASMGVGVPYGNVDVMPFEKRYFGGGANGVRGWQVRSLGPGTYTDDRLNYMNQSGDIRLYASLEYRFKLIWVVEGALFADAGNIWTIRDYAEDQPGGAFGFDTFYDQIAFAYGVGARFDFSFFVFRLDFGIKGYDPIRDASSRWVDSPSFNNDMTLHLAIGYPF